MWCFCWHTDGRKSITVPHKLPDPPQVVWRPNVSTAALALVFCHKTRPFIWQNDHLTEWAVYRIIKAHLHAAVGIATSNHHKQTFESGHVSYSAPLSRMNCSKCFCRISPTMCNMAFHMTTFGAQHPWPQNSSLRYSAMTNFSSDRCSAEWHLQDKPKVWSGSG